eukprot:9644979-Lingulodinium_polyedra.AAC.1
MFAAVLRGGPSKHAGGPAPTLRALREPAVLPDGGVPLRCRGQRRLGASHLELRSRAAGLVKVASHIAGGPGLSTAGGA